MAYYYVKSGGTAAAATDNGRYASQQTGSFATLGAAGYYNCLADAILATTPPATGDWICLSDAHAYSGTSNATTTTGSPRTGDFVYVVTVSDTACDTLALATAAQEHITGGTLDPSIGGQTYRYGLWIKGDDNINFSSQAAQVYEKCTFEVTGSSDIALTQTVMHTGTYYIDCAFMNVTGAGLNTLDGNSTFIRCSFNWAGCQFTTAATGNITFIDCDLSNLTGNNLFTGFDGNGTGGANIRVLGCKMPASYTLGAITRFHTNVLFANSSDVSAEAEYQYKLYTFGGTVEADTAIYRTATAAFPSGTKTSLRVDTNTYLFPMRPMRFELPGMYAALSNGASNNVKIYLLSSDSGLTSADVYAELHYPDGTNKNVYNSILTRPAFAFPPSTGTALTTNTEAWTGRTTETRYEINIDTSGDAGADTAIGVTLHVTKQSITLYVCPTIELT